jgi:hypothetical protein
MKCAVCAVNWEELCESLTIEGVKEPRICKKCLVKNINEGEQPIDFGVWIQQIMSLPNGKEMLERLAELDRDIESITPPTRGGACS